MTPSLRNRKEGFEFMGRLGSNRAILFESRNKDVKLPSDMAGFTTITYRFDKGSLDVSAHLALACNQLRNYVNRLGGRKDL